MVNEITSIYEEQLEDIFVYLSTGVEKGNAKKKSRRYCLSQGGDRLCRRVGGSIYQDYRVVIIPIKQERNSILKQVHDGCGHFGTLSTWQRLYNHYWWPNAYQETKLYISHAIIVN
jgi:hypothetical protein